jgi:glyoxylase-like metal-dependent hydrolase (beta-lactamase superfamily II)
LEQDEPNRSKTVKRIFTRGKRCWSVTAALVLAIGGAYSIRAAELDSSGLDVVKVRPDFYVIAGDGGNIGVQIGMDGIILVNAGAGAKSDQVLAELKKLSDLPIRYIINTDAGPDFVGGNLKLGKAGLGVVNGSNGQAAILAHQSVLTKMSARDAKPSYPGDAWPNEAFLAKRHSFRMNDQGIEVWYEPAAHSDADSFAMFRRSDVVVTGDVMDTTRFPVIDLAHGGSIQGEIDALNKLIELTIAPIPYIYKDVGTYVVPGHGRVCEQMEVVDYRDMVVIVRDNIADLIKQGKTLDQAKAAHPALAFETRYGREPGATDGFVESIYKSLTAKK